MSDREDLPIFPLRTILFPDSKLPLRIFEPRYIDMVSRCMREDSEFGIILSRESTDPKMFETYDTSIISFKHFRICAFSTENDPKLTIFSHTSADHINIPWLKNS